MYGDFAYVYDKLTNDLDHLKCADYIEAILNKTGVKPEMIVDLGCGTGSFCTEMAVRGYDMIGIDQSADMLSCAKDKAIERELDILYLQQDMTDFELYGTVDCIVCLHDSVNYVTDKRQLKRMFRLVHSYLNIGGLFIFDINTRYKLEKVLGNNVFYDIDDEIACLWQNSFDKKRGICQYDVTFFVREGSLYRRYDEIHEERAYTTEEIAGALQHEKLQVIDVFDDLSFEKPTKKSERIFFVCKK